MDPYFLNNGLFKRVIRYPAKYKEAITNSLKYPYSDEKSKGKNNLIQGIKRIAFGFRTFTPLGCVS